MGAPASALKVGFSLAIPGTCAGAATTCCHPGGPQGCRAPRLRRPGFLESSAFFPPRTAGDLTPWPSAGQPMKPSFSSQ
jgi:hypothetical protein